MFWFKDDEGKPIPLKVQAYSSQSDDWYVKEFQNEQELIEYIEQQFLVPGEYHLRNTVRWQDTGRAYAKSVTKPNFEGGKYHNFTYNSLKEKNWKAKEKDRILNGVIYDGWYLPPFYYWYLNFCPIYDDFLKKKRFGDVWDSDFWYMQYCMLAILKGKHIGGVKGRQKGYSYKHMAILYWSYCWFENSVNTVGAYDEKLVKKSWRFLEGYRAHINNNTTWRRGPQIPKSLEWHESQMDEAGRPQGLQSKLAGVTFKQKADNDVGGSTTFFNYEEPGVSPTILETLEFVRPSLEKGSETTGIIIACGSVGNLDDAKGIKTIFYDPDSYNFLGMPNIWDKKNKNKKCCIFISEAYNMIGKDDFTGEPFMDKDGNSNVKLALAWIERKAEETKNSNKTYELKQLALSQKCISPEQAFDQRTKSEFPIELLRAQQERIKLKDKMNLWDYKPQKGLFKEVDGTVVLDTNNPPREHIYPIDPTWEDKRGVWTIYEPVDPNPDKYLYFASVDAVEVDVTNTSPSVAAVDIFKAPIQVEYEKADGTRYIKIEGDKLVATYRGRFDTAKKTNEQIWLGLKLYNAWCYPERNKPNFINYMRETGRAERYLAKESDVPLFKDMNISKGNVANNSKFGFHKGDNTEVWKHFKTQAKEYFEAEYGREENSFGETIKIFTGIDRIDDYWLLEELILYVEGDGENYDRLVSFFGALFIAKTYQQNRFIKKRSEVPKKEAEVPKPPKVKSMLGGFNNNQYNSNRARKQKSML